MADIVNLGERRVDKTKDCRDWTVADALREALRQVESGEINPSIAYVALYEQTQDNGCEFG